MTRQLEAVERASGAQMVPFGESVLPARFGDGQQEYAAVRQRCGLLDAGFRAVLRLTGGDRVSFLQGMLSNDVARLRDGDGIAAALLTQQGKVVSDLRVYALRDEMWLDVPAGRAAAVRAALAHFIIADDVEFVDDPAWVPLVAVEGPHADRVLVGVTGTALAGTAPWAHQEVHFDGAPLRAVAVGHAGMPGYLLIGDPAVAERLWAHCRAAGAEPVGMDALDVLRVEAGIPWHGCDMDEDTLIGEVGLADHVSYKKGCYLGQEVVERLAARGQVQRKLVGLLCAGPTIPPAETTLRHEGKDVGWTTSAVWSPARASVVALAYVRRERWDPGTTLDLVIDGQTTTAQVTTLPFYGAKDSGTGC